MNFKSIVVVDLETTSLRNARITELTMVAAERGHLSNGNGDVPRAIHKITLCINPRQKIDAVASAMTGLENEDLQNLQHMNENVVDCIGSFLNHVPAPYCLVAHNGLKFDFPVLKKELASLQGQITLEDCFLVDSLDFFRDLFLRNKQHPPAPIAVPAPRLVPVPLARLISPPVCELLANEEEDAICLQALRDYEASLPQQEILLIDISSSPSIQSSIETTPPCRVPTDPSPPHKQRRLEQHNIPHTTRRQLTFSPTNGSPLNKPTSFQLGDVYEFFVGEPMPHSHMAEVDCLALLKCIACIPEEFFTYAEQNYVLFNSINPRA